MKRHLCKGFTIIELLVVVSIIALLIGILLPAIGKARDNAKVSVSRSNLRELGIAMHTYASDWEDRQYTPTRDTLASYGSVQAYNSQVYGGANIPDDGGLDVRWKVHPPIQWGWGPEGHMWTYLAAISPPVALKGSGLRQRWVPSASVRAMSSLVPVST